MKYKLIGPFNLLPHKENSICNVDKPGVYLWCVKVNDKYLVNYVGVSKQIGKRQLEHLEYFLTGKFTIYSVPELINGIKAPLYTPLKNNFVQQFLKNFNELKDTFITHLELYQIFYFELPDDKAHRKMHETAIISSLKDSKNDSILANTRKEYPFSEFGIQQFELETAENIVGVSGVSFNYKLE